MSHIEGYTATMRCCEWEYIGMTEVDLYDERGRHMYTSCQLVDGDDPEILVQIIKDMNDWCLDNKEPKPKLGEKILWYKIG